MAVLLGVFSLTGAVEVDTAVSAASAPFETVPISAVFNPREWLAILALLVCSAFFSASEVAFFSLHRLHLRSMREGAAMERLVTRLMQHPGSLLTSILMGNSVVNVLLSVLMALPVDNFYSNALKLPVIVSYILSVATCTAILVFFGEIFPKVLVVRKSKQFAVAVAVPIFLIDRAMTPFRNAIILLTGLLFRITRFSEVRPAPFMTDEEFFSLLTESEASGVIEKDERQMIQGILELSDVMVREILVPRPDIIAVKAASTVEEALAVFRKHEFSRIPVYEEDMDHITGILYAKDLLSYAVQGIFDQSITPMLRQIHYVPETMTVANFVKMTQSSRAHIAVVVDEFGGTEGIVTLQDALREVVGELGEEDEESRSSIKELEEDVYRIDGSLPLDELEILIDHKVDDAEHTTVAGFIMDQLDKIPEEGDVMVQDGVKYVVEEVQGKRIAQLRVEVTKLAGASGEES